MIWMQSLVRAPHSNFISRMGASLPSSCVVASVASPAHQGHGSGDMSTTPTEARAVDRDLRFNSKH